MRTYFLGIKFPVIDPNLKASGLIKSWPLHSIFWFFISFLVFIQDYIESSINDFDYFLSETLIFKTFWLLFIPISILWVKTIDWFHFKLASRLNRNLCLPIVFLSIIFSLFHLSLFVLLLKSLNFLLHNEAWQLSWLIKDTISERFYFPIVTYFGLGWFYQWLKKRELIKEARKTIKVKHGTKSQLVDMDDIEYVNIENSVTRIGTQSQKYIYQGSLKQIGDLLDHNKFKRVHRSTIINTEAVQHLNSRQNGDYDVLMKGGTSLRLSRRYVAEVRGILL